MIYPGLTFRKKDIPSDNIVQQVPFTLFPTPFPLRLYNECLSIQPILNKLLFRLSDKLPYINDQLGKINDGLAEKLLDIANYCAQEGLAQPIQSCICRSDYMLDLFKTESGYNNLRARQVEINAIASGMSSLSTTATSIHNYIMSKYHIDDNNRDGLFFPTNNSLELVVTGLVDAFNCYGKSDSYILLVNEPRSFNFRDHVMIERTIHQMRPDIRIVRRCITMLTKFKHGPNKELLVDGNKEIAVVYFRYGYDPTHYLFNNKEAWNLRLLLERSRAIKCPSVNFHLAGFKKFQQVLNTQQELEQFLYPNESGRLAKVFCKLYSLDQDTEEGKLGLSFGIENYDKLVLKPQLEGGGHNFFGDEVLVKLESLKQEELRQFILMEYINSPKERNWLLKPEQDYGQDARVLETQDYLVSELGIYGSVLGSTGRILSNKSAGYLVRSKNLGAKENGVASGFAGLSSLVLVDDTREDLDLGTFYGENLSAHRSD